MANSADETFMWAALAEARRGLGKASPNPAVGAVLVQRGRIIATGYHRASGLPHAEIECLANAPSPALRSATLYVTLEPCSTTGRTPPCTEAIVRAGVGRVVLGATDPNPRHSGRGIRAVESGGNRSDGGRFGRRMQPAERSVQQVDRNGQAVRDREMRDEPGRSPDEIA